MDHRNHRPLDPTGLTPSVLQGATNCGADDNKLGKLDHIQGSGSGSGSGITAIIDVGGFRGTGAKPVGVPMADLQVMRDQVGDVHAVTTGTKDELREMLEKHD